MSADWAVLGYTEIGELGRGATGRVVLARSEADGALVAVKYLSGRLTGDPGFVDRVRREAVLMARVVDPNVVRVHELVVASDDRNVALVMEAVLGVTVRTLITRRGQPPESALAMLRGSLLGLAAAHRAGVVHRDYKPDNVLVDAAGCSKLTDFGIAAPAGEGAPAEGTPAYMPPEQWHGQAASPASDMYAAAVTFYECVTGRRPFRSDTMAGLRAMHETAPVPIDTVPVPVRPLLVRALAKNPGERHADIAEFLADVEATAAAGYGTDWLERGLLGLGAVAGVAISAAPLLALGASGVAGTVGAGTAGTVGAGAAGAAGAAGTSAGAGGAAAAAGAAHASAHAAQATAQAAQAAQASAQATAQAAQAAHAATQAAQASQVAQTAQAAQAAQATQAAQAAHAMPAAHAGGHAAAQAGQAGHAAGQAAGHAASAAGQAGHTAAQAGHAGAHAGHAAGHATHTSQAHQTHQAINHARRASRWTRRGAKLLHGKALVATVVSATVVAGGTTIAVVTATRKSSGGNANAACAAAWQINEEAKGAGSAIDLTALQLRQAAAFTAAAAKTDDPALKSAFLDQAADWSRQAKDPSNKHFYDTVSDPYVITGFNAREALLEKLTSMQALEKVCPGTTDTGTGASVNPQQNLAWPAGCAQFQTAFRSWWKQESTVDDGSTEQLNSGLSASANQMAATMNTTADSATDPALKSAFQTYSTDLAALSTARAGYDHGSDENVGKTVAAQEAVITGLCAQ